MDKNVVVKWIFRVLFLAVVVYQAIIYVNYDNIVENDVPIHYTYVSKAAHTSGRADWYEMRIMYKDKQYSVDITSSTYEAIDENELPSLYYSIQHDAVFSLWEKKRALRLIAVCTVFFLITFIPVNRWLQK